MKAWSRQGEGKVRARLRGGLGEVKTRSRIGQGKGNIRLKQSNHNHNNYNLTYLKKGVLFCGSPGTTPVGQSGRVKRVAG